MGDKGWKVSREKSEDGRVGREMVSNDEGVHSELTQRETTVIEH